MSVEPDFDRPIPGMSLTAELGGRAWQKPPRFTAIKDVAEYYVERLSDDAFTTKLVEVSELGIPITTIANTIQMDGVMQGIHSIDSGMLVLPIIMEMLLLILDASGVDYNSGMDESTEDTPTEKEVLLNRLQKFKEQQLNESEEDTEAITEEISDMPVEEIPQDLDMSGGLMSRRQ